MKVFVIASLLFSVLLVGGSYAPSEESGIITNYMGYVESMMRIRLDNLLMAIEKLADKIYDATPASIQSNLKGLLIQYMSRDLPNALKSNDNLQLKAATVTMLQLITDEVGVLSRYDPSLKVVEVAKREVENFLPVVAAEDNWFLRKVEAATDLVRSKLTPEQAERHARLLNFFNNGVPQPFYEEYENVKTESFEVLGL